MILIALIKFLPGVFLSVYFIKDTPITLTSRRATGLAGDSDDIFLKIWCPYTKCPPPNTYNKQERKRIELYHSNFKFQIK